MKEIEEREWERLTVTEDDVVASLRQNEELWNHGSLTPERERETESFQFPLWGFGFSFGSISGSEFPLQWKTCVGKF